MIRYTGMGGANPEAEAAKRAAKARAAQEEAEALRFYPGMQRDRAKAAAVEAAARGTKGIDAALRALYVNSMPTASPRAQVTAHHEAVLAAEEAEQVEMYPEMLRSVLEADEDARAAAATPVTTKDNRRTT